MTNEEETWPVELYVYDLSRGMARQLSMALTGRLMEGIWHTSIVVHGQEVFYGQGVSITKPGQSHHGSPQQTYSLGRTSIDAASFSELLDSIRDRYTAERYHLLEWNCNTFTNEVSELLTGNGIPSHIKSLPADFLSTPFGQAMRPQIDAMFRPASTSHAPAAPLSGGSINGLLGQVASQAFGSNGPVGSSETGLSGRVGSDGVQTLRTPADLEGMLKAAPCVAVLFTSETCPPCKIVQPHFSSLAASHTPKGSTAVSKQILFGRVDSGPATSALFSARSVRATPTVQVFVRGEKRGEVAGADLGEVTTQVDLVLFEVYPPHPHTKLKLPSIRHLPSSPTLFSAVPSYRSLVTKLDALLGSLPSSSFSEKADRQDARRLVANKVIPALEQRFGTGSTGGQATAGAALVAVVPEWTQAYQTLSSALALPALFPLLDLLRLACLDSSASTSLIPLLRSTLTELASDTDALTKADAKATLLVSLRLVSNILSQAAPASSLREEMLPIITTGLLHADAGVRSAASTALFNSTLLGRSARVDFCVPPEEQQKAEAAEFWSSDQQMELLPALVESVTLSCAPPTSDGKSGGQAETLHRLAASALNLLHLAPMSNLDNMGPLLEVLDAPEVWTEAAAVTWGHEAEDAKMGEVRKVCDDVLTLVRATIESASS